MALESAGRMFSAPDHRVEDDVLLTGQANFVADFSASDPGFDGVLEAAFVRSTVAHGRIQSIDADDALALPGVVAVLTASDLDLPDYVFPVRLNDEMRRPALARDKVHFVGDLIAVVLGTSRGAAEDGAAAVVVDIEAMHAEVDPEAALRPDATLQFEDVGTNLVTGERSPDQVDVLADADVVVRGRFENQRVAVVPMEASAIAALPGTLPDQPEGAHELTIYMSTQFPHMSRSCIATAFGIVPDRLRVIAPHVGGGFGGKMWAPEHISVIGAARRLQRPVRWVETRSDNLVSMAHGRAQVQYVEMGFRRDGSITGLRCRMIGDAGAYAGFGGGLVMGATYTMAQGVYRIPAIDYAVAVVTTNTTPVGAYRGAGRPEAAAFLERVIDMAAYELAIDPVELRRRNFIPPDAFPFATLTGVTYDSGDYDGALVAALAMVDHDALRSEQAARRAAGDRVQLGIGIGCYVEITGGTSTSEFAEVEVDEHGVATVKVGTSAHGQGHATVFSALVAERLGVPLESVRFVQSDTARVPRGGGTGGSRSGHVGGSAIAGASEALIDVARNAAAELFEASAADVTFGDGRFSVAGVPAVSASWADVAVHVRERGEDLRAQFDFSQTGATFPFGAHIAVVEVDTETGRVVPRDFVAVDDCGLILNRMIVDGQVHGGVATGIGQALYEQVVYDEIGNPLTSTLAEYAMPSAAELPSIRTAHTQTSSPRNPLGAKGIGESGSVGATPAIQNAVVDALAHLGVRHIDIPCTPERVWRTIQQATNGDLRDPWREPPTVFAGLPVRAAGTRPEEVNL